VADFFQQKVYQQKPDSGEVRVISVEPCHPDTLALDPSNGGFYAICRGGQYYFIRKINGSVNEVIYNAPQGKEQYH